MSRELTRRLAALEAAYPATTVRRALTNDDRALLTALEAMAIALVSGKWAIGIDPLDALYHGIENALYRMDCTSPLRYPFARRFDDALNISLNGCESVACPIDKQARLIQLSTSEGGGELIQSFIGLRDARRSLQDCDSYTKGLTIFDRKGVERYRWPDRERGEQPRPVGSARVYKRPRSIGTEPRPAGQLN